MSDPPATLLGMELPTCHPAVSSALAADRLREAQGTLGTIDSVLVVGNDSEKQVGYYLEQTRCAVRQMDSVFEGNTGADLLYTEGFWPLQAHGLTIPRLAEAIGTEIRSRLLALQRLEARFAAEAKRWRHHVQGTLLVPDTSVFLEPGLDLPTFDWVVAAHGSGFSGNAHVVVPITVVDELDSLKRNNNTKQAARAALKWLAARLPAAGATPTMLQDERVPITSLQAYVTRAPSRPDDADNEIIQAAEMIRDRSGISTILLTRDLSMRLRADQAGLVVRFRETET